MDAPADAADVRADRILVSATVDVRAVPLDRLRDAHRNPATPVRACPARPVLSAAAFNASL